MPGFTAFKPTDMVALPEFSIVHNNTYDFDGYVDSNQLKIPGTGVAAHIRLDFRGGPFSGSSYYDISTYTGDFTSLTVLHRVEADDGGNWQKGTPAYQFVSPGFPFEDLWDYAVAGNLKGALTRFFSGDDGLVGSDGADRLLGFAGADSVLGRGGADTLDGGDGDDDVSGGAGNNKLAGGKGDDFPAGGLGDDLLEGGAGADTLLGGKGNKDTASYAGSTLGVTVDLAKNTASGGHAGGDTVLQVENLIGSGKADKLTGNAGGNSLDGGAGGDTLVGGLGGDTLIGGAAGDTMTGGGGNDRFVFAAKGFGRDTITDFAAGPGIGDVIAIAKSVLASFAAVKSHASVDAAQHVVIKATATDWITLNRVHKVADLSPNDFLFT